MLAKRKSDGKVIEGTERSSWNGEKIYTADGTFYRKVELDFDVEEAEQTESAVVSGWVARDEDGFISLFNDKPTRDYCDKNDIPYGFWDEANGHHLELPITSFPSLAWESEPLEVTITIKPKKQ